MSWPLGSWRHDRLVLTVRKAHLPWEETECQSACANNQSIEQARGWRKNKDGPPNIIWGMLCSCCTVTSNDFSAYPEANCSFFTQHKVPRLSAACPTAASVAGMSSAAQPLLRLFKPSRAVLKIGKTQFSRVFFRNKMQWKSLSPSD